MESAQSPMLPKQDLPAAKKAEPLLSCALYMFVSVSMTFINKYTMQVFPLTNIVMIMQMLATWLVLEPLRPYLGFKPFNFMRARQFLYITIMYTASTAFALIGLRTLTVPMYNVIKRLTPMTVLIIKAFVRKQWPATQIIASVVMVVCGCIIAGLGDLVFSLSGYTFCLLSCACQAAYLLLVEFQGRSAYAPVSSQEMLYYNSITSLPLLAPLALAEGEVHAFPTALSEGHADASSSELLYYNSVTSLPLLGAIAAFEGEVDQISDAYAAGVQKHGTFWLWFAVLSCSFMGCLLNYSLFWCTTTNTALTTTIVGVLKGVVSVGLGFVLLGGVPFSWLNVIGITMNTVGGIWYAYIKYNTKERKG